METIKAVITADIVNSTLLGKSQMNALKKTIEAMLQKRKMTYSFYRGDSFNTVCEIKDALKTVCLLRTMAIQHSDKSKKGDVDIRFAIGIGKVEEPFKELSIAKGEAFILSGREMDQMQKNGPRLSIRCTDPLLDIGMPAIALFTDYILKKMTVKQSQVVFELLLGATQVEAAKKLKRSQSTINKHAFAADWKNLIRLMDLYTRLCDFA